MSDYDVIWTTPGQSCADSMPLGNGDIGLNAWTEPNGDLLFYVSKTDAWNENNRLLKLGCIRVSLAPALEFSEGFQQILFLETATMEVRTAGKVLLRLWVDANAPVVRLEINSDTPRDVKVSLETWRTEERVLEGQEQASAYGQNGGPNPIIESPDYVLPNQQNRVVWFHRNEKSIWAQSMALQSLDDLASCGNDPLLHRTFGAAVLGDGLICQDDQTLISSDSRCDWNLTIHPLTAQTATAEEWLSQLDEQIERDKSTYSVQSLEAHKNWWHDFWDRSYIHIDGTPEAGVVSRGYALQRFINACGGRGAYPIKFNGSIFTVPTQENNGVTYDADYRRWGGTYWFQNTRLTYWPMLAAGDFDLMQPFFKMYCDALPLAIERTQKYFHHGGAFFPETITFWGAYADSNYGWEREGRDVSFCENTYIRYYWSGALELCALMLQYVEFSSDEEFCHEKLLPMARQILRFYDEHYPREDGVLKMEPAQSLEMFWEVVNPLPDIAGLQFVLDKLLTFFDSLIRDEDRVAWTKLRGELPPLPRRAQNGKSILAAAQEIRDEKHNSENPELYAVFPYSLFGIDKPELQMARDTFANRLVKSSKGWQQDAIQAACLGLTEETQQMVVSNFSTSHQGSRFPAFWGPNFDWIPDQDHGGVAMLALQKMLMQCDGAKVLLFPAWPRDWNVSFRLHAPQNTIITGEFKTGKLVLLDVKPARRRGDITFPDDIVR